MGKYLTAEKINRRMRQRARRNRVIRDAKQFLASVVGGGVFCLNRLRNLLTQPREAIGR